MVHFVRPMNTLAATKKEPDNTALWILGLAAVAAGLYYLFKPKEEEPGPGQTEAMPLPPLNQPLEYETIGAVATTFDNLMTNWRMGRVEPRAAWDTTTQLIHVIRDLRDAGIGEEATAQALIAQIENLRKDITDYIKLTDVA